MYGAQAVESMQRKYAEQIQARADELEEKLRTKDAKIEDLQSELQTFHTQLRSGVMKDDDKSRENERKVVNLEQLVKQKDFDLEKLKKEIQEKDSDIKVLAETFEREYEALRLENERNVHELQNTFKENIKKNRPSSASSANAKSQAET